MYTSGSSIRFKDIITEVSNSDIETFYHIPIYWYKYKLDYLSDSDERYDKLIPGFIAEDIDKIAPIAVDHDTDGIPEMWNSNIVVPIMFQMIKNEHERNDKLQQEIAELKEMIKSISTR